MTLIFSIIDKIYLSNFIENKMAEILKNNFPTVNLSIKDLRQRIDLLMTSANPALGFIRPITPKTIQLGFMHIEEAKELPEGNLKKFLDEADQGVIYVSFGSNVESKNLSEEKLKLLVNVFRNLPFRIVWKYESDSLPGISDNIMISKWLPQQDLLAHPNIKLFISQGGLQSIEEAIDREIPMVIMPFVFDQLTNAIRMQHKKVGLFIDSQTLTENKLRDAINEMIKPEYKENVRKLKNIVRDEPLREREKAAWWVEYVIRHNGTKHLNYLTKDIPTHERFYLDFLLIGILSLFLIYKAFRIIFKLLCKSDKKLKLQ